METSQDSALQEHCLEVEEMASLRGDDLGESRLVQEVGEMVDLRGEEQDSANDGDAGDSFALDPEPMEKDLSDGRLGVGNAGGAAVCRTTVPFGVVCG